MQQSSSKVQRLIPTVFRVIRRNRRIPRRKIFKNSAPTPERCFLRLFSPQDLRIRHESIKFATTNSFTSYQLKYICL